jgi:flagellar biosynthetic protein FliQ
MTDVEISNIAMQAMIVAAKLSAPILLTALLIGFAISLMQALTQIQEVTLSFVPKIIGVGIAILLSGNWMLAEIMNFTENMYERVPQLLGLS